MNTLLIIALVIAMGATAYVLVRGVIAMANGKDSGAVQQKYMQKRVMYQAVAILIVALILLLAGGGRS
jgi:L-asparagine transporter-like permease